MPTWWPPQKRQKREAKRHAPERCPSQPQIEIRRFAKGNATREYCSLRDSPPRDLELQARKPLIGITYKLCYKVKPLYNINVVSLESQAWDVLELELVELS